MKLLIAILLLLPFTGRSQKTVVNEYDKFIKQRRIELEPMTVHASENASVYLTFNSIGQGLYLLISGSGWGASTIDAGQEVIFLLSNDSTVTCRSTGLQSYQAGTTKNSYKHKYSLRTADIDALSTHEIIAIRKYSFNDYSDLKVSAQHAARVKKSGALFMEELKKSRVIQTLRHISVTDVAKHIGDSVMFCTKVFNTRYFEASENAPTLLDVNNSFGKPLVNVIIWEQDRNNFSNAPERLYLNRDVCISGLVQLVNNAPQLTVRQREQIRLRSPVSLSEVQDFIGDSVTVQGRVVSGKYFSESQNQPTLLNMGQAFPNQALTLVIENKDRLHFDAAPENYYTDKEISVTGKIALYKGQPQIVVRGRQQIIENSPLVMQVKNTVNNNSGGTAVKTTDIKKEPPMVAIVKATYPGGNEAFSKFLQHNLVSPEELETGDMKQVVITFMVNTDGTTGNFKISQSAGSKFDEEVLRVMRRMPKWEPQLRNGLPVAEIIMQPVTFKR